MSTDFDRWLLELAHRLQAGCAGNTALFRETVEATLRPMIRCAMRRGIGQPTLVDWVRHELTLVNRDAGSRPDPVLHAARLARVLAERIVDRLDPLPGRETVLAA